MMVSDPMTGPMQWAQETIPASAGIGLKAQHYQDILAEKPAIGWVEVHTENYMGEGGAAHYYLGKIREDYPLSLHGVGLSLGSADGLDQDHLDRIKQVMDRYDPGLISEHVSFSTINGQYFNDLLPLPYTEEALKILCENIMRCQDHLGRRLLVENPSTYLEYNESHIPEYEFLNETVARTGCGLLLDINNIYVSCSNHGRECHEYLRQIRPEAVAEYHLAGHTEKVWRNRVLRIDDHGANVSREVWELYEKTLELMGPRPTLIEWDTNVPSLLTLLQEAERAEHFLGAAKHSPGPAPLGRLK